MNNQLRQNEILANDFCVLHFCHFKYKEGEQVVFWMNTVGPYHNLQETYDFFSLPFCKGPTMTVEHYHENLADALLGIELVFSGLDVRFKG